MSAKFAIGAVTIAAGIFFLTGAAPAQEQYGARYGFDPAYARHYGFTPDYDAFAYSGGGYDEAASECARRHRSYDPSTGTFRGTDGRRHLCP